MKRTGAGALAADGRRVRIEPEATRGRFTTARYLGFALLIAVYLGLPFLRIDGRPALHLDVHAGRFFILGGLFDATDAWRLVFVLLVAAACLLLSTAALGRAWCGWACPQTVFLDGLIRPIDRWFPRRRGARGVLHLAVRHAAYFGVATLCAHAFIAYFVKPAALLRMIQEGPGAEPGVFAFAAIATGLLYFDLAYFREQLCLIVCPYGRLQSALTDKDSLVVGYDAGRGEPRGKLAQAGAGDCVDCRRCIAVCPTAIDIRKGQQLDCLGCTACIDACDEIMVKIGRKPGLIRYDSENGLAGQPRRFLRPRLFVYAGVVAAAVAGLGFATVGRAGVDLQILRPVGAPYTLAGEEVENVLHLVVVNKASEPLAAPIEASVPLGASVVCDPWALSLPPLGRATIVLRVRFPRATPLGARRIQVRVAGESATATLVAPGGRP